MAAASKFFLLYVAAVLVGLLLLVIKCTKASTVYTVGDSSGWDISSDLDSWVQDKKFEVGDVLLFQYSTDHSVSEVKKESYDECNVTKNVIQSTGNRNTSISLPMPGERYFVCGNVLHCLGGMKLHVTVNKNQTGAANSPAIAPQANTESGGARTPPSSLRLPTINPAASSKGFVVVNGGREYLVFAFLCIVGTVLSLAVVI